MDQISLAKWLKAILIGIALCGIVFYAVVVPITANEAVASWPEFENRRLPWLLLVWITGVPCFAALFLGWRIVSRIRNDRSFTVENARDLKWISRLAAGDAAAVLAGNLLLAFLGMSHPGVLLLSFVVTFIGVALAVVAAALSCLVGKAAGLQEQSDLTI